MVMSLVKGGYKIAEKLAKEFMKPNSNKQKIMQKAKDSKVYKEFSEIKSGNEYCIEAIILKEPERRDVQTKAGETISLGEMFVEDTTGQIWIKGWKNQAKFLDGLSKGEIISITTVNAKPGLDGKIELFLTPYSTIAKKI